MKALALTFLLLLCAPAFGQEVAFETVLESARQGKAWAQNEVGGMYSSGIGVTRSQKKAVYWFEKAAEQGSALGACNLGLRYGLGWGVGKDLTLAMKWLFVGTAVDAPRCHYGDYVGTLRPDGHDMRKGYELATVWLRARPELTDESGRRPWMERNWPDSLAASEKKAASKKNTTGRTKKDEKNAKAAQARN